MTLFLLHCDISYDKIYVNNLCAGNIFNPPVLGSVPVVEVDLARSKVDTKDGLGTKLGLQTKEGSKVSASLNI